MMPPKPFLLFVLLFGLITPLFSQRKYQISELSGSKPRLDGLLNDSCWRNVPIADTFTTSTPVFGQTPKNGARVRLLKANDGIYIGVECVASVVRSDPGFRDAVTSGDRFSIAFDTWHDRQNALRYEITPLGLQSDALIGGNGTEVNFDAAWYSAVHKEAAGWTAELFIPWKALRFPVKGEQHWGLQMGYFCQSSGEYCTWNPQQPLIGDEVLQYGDLEGLGIIKQELRLGIYSYVNLIANPNSSYFAPFFPYSEDALKASMGIDGRWGINSAATLDVSLLPATNYTYSSFAQESKLEIGQNPALPGPRQFTAEAAPLFAKSHIQWENPAAFTVTSRNPLIFRRSIWECDSCRYSVYSQPQLRNTARFSARMRGGWGLGVYQAIYSGASVEVFRKDNSSFTENQAGISYTMATVEKSLPNNSWINLSAGALVGGEAINSQTGSADVQLRDRSNRYFFKANVQGLLWGLRRDSVLWNGQYALALGKANGAWAWSVMHKSPSMYFSGVNSPLVQFDAYGNGIHTGPYAVSELDIRHRQYHPLGRMLQYELGFRFSKTWMRDHIYRIYGSAVSRRFQRWYGEFNYNPYYQLIRYLLNDLYLTQKVSPDLRTNLRWSSDQRKRLQLGIQALGSARINRESGSAGFEVSEKWVINSFFTQSLSWNFNMNFRNLTPYKPDNMGQRQLNGFDKQRSAINWQVEFSPNRRFYLGVRFSTVFEKSVRLRQFKLEQDGSLSQVPIDPDNYFPQNEYLLYRFTMRYFANQIHQFRFEMYRDYQVLDSIGTNYAFSTRLRTKFNLSIISFLDPVKSRTFAPHE